MWKSMQPGRPGLGVSAAIAALLAAGCGGGSGDAGDSQAQAGRIQPEKTLEIRTVSNRADLVTDGDALVEIVLPERAALPSLKVAVNGRDVSDAFAQRADGRVTGLVTGLSVGSNVLTAQAGGGRRAQLTLTNATRGGPVYSGTQVVPFFCATPVPQPTGGTGENATPATNASGLQGQPDAQCNIATEYKLYYRSTASANCTFGLPDPSPSVPPTATAPAASVPPPSNACFKPYDPAGPQPLDMATTTTDDDRTVPYIVRVERGTMNRGIYDIAVLFDPARPWSATAPQAQWNGKVYYNFGASTGQPRRQVRPATAWTSLSAQIGRGWLVVMNSMTDSARNSNRVLMSETVMMMKERIGDGYGPIRYTMGAGCSGGSINSNMNASINPGLLDGITTTCTYPDSETTTLEVGDCVLLVDAYQKPQMASLWGTLTQAQVNAKKAAINGHPDQSACHAWYNAFGSNGRAGVYQPRLVADNVTGAIVQRPTPTNNCEMPNSAVYDPARPAATAHLPRCNAWSWAEPIWGKVPGSPAAQDTRDNVGVQYGLKALQDGAISGEEFVTLNEIVGGIDRDSTPRAQRTTADMAALETAYRAGIVASGRQLAKTAIIDMRGWDDSNINVPPGQTPGTNAIPIHHQWFSFAVRDRIAAEAGDANNQALWRFARTGLTPPGTMALDAFLTMDQWLTALKADTSDTPLHQKVRQARPASSRDFCLLPGDASQSVKVTDQAVCDADPFLKPSLSPRQVAGGPRREDVLKCQLKPVNDADYAGRLDAGQLARLRAVFSTGVCDWSQPGMGQQVAVSPLNFSAGPGGVPFGPAPASVPR
ncbi:DUF6351 family protein [Ramlibacter tataouinensis]|uniref:DUF6351 domain-containing protein n=1 Tax=Ramlibacter tataouinensis (strain ATCC BAA-407 / DSM 14655 / LMG 21543 / TTB310) TaxID=365046 RepID=F5Y234_RAMTT|nr:DUF6351 family protein [Ramlibacter tataouinensis]AEG94802.1 Conserved hypothetical protein [Ramlibacter tataouinensis TTB310]